MSTGKEGAISTVSGHELEAEVYAKILGAVVQLSPDLKQCKQLALAVQLDLPQLQAWLGKAEVVFQQQRVRTDKVDAAVRALAELTEAEYSKVVQQLGTQQPKPTSLPMNIIFNGKAITLSQQTMTYGDLCGLAGIAPSRLPTITLRCSGTSFHSTVTPGEYVTLRTGLVIDCVVTDKA